MVSIRQMQRRNWRCPGQPYRQSRLINVEFIASEILQFAELYNVSVLSLMSDEESEQSVKKNQMTRLLQYQSAFQKMNEDKQKQVLKYMEQLQDES